MTTIRDNNSTIVGSNAYTTPLYQSFTASSTYVPKSIDLYLDNNTSSDEITIIQILNTPDGVTRGSVIAEARLPNISNTTKEKVKIYFSSSANIIAGNKYLIDVFGSGYSDSNCWIYSGDTNFDGTLYRRIDTVYIQDPSNNKLYFEIYGDSVVTRTLTTSAINGTITKSPDQSTYTSGTSVSLNAIPAEGYAYANWTGDLTGSANPTSIVMDADKSVTAVFEVAGGGGSSTLTNDIVSYYKMDGNAQDSVGTNHGTLGGDPQVTTGKINQGYSFDGSNDYIDLKTLKNMGTVFTFSAFVSAEIGVVQHIFSQSLNSAGHLTIGIGIDSSGHLFIRGDRIGGSFHLADTEVLSETSFSQIVVLANGDNIKLYVNGNLRFNSSINPDLLYTSVFASVIGSFKYGAQDRYFKGKIDEVGIWNRALTQAEVTELYGTLGAGNQYPFGSGGVTTRTSEITGTASLQKRTYTTINGTASLSKTNEKTITGTAELHRIRSNEIQGSASLEKVGKQNIYGTSYLHKVSSNTVSGDAFLRTADNKYTISGDAYIEKKSTSTISGNAYLFKVLDGNIYGNAFLHKITDTTINGDAYLHKVTDTTLTGDAFLNKCNEEQVTGDAYLEKKNRAYITGDASLWQQNFNTITGDAFLFKQFKYKPVIHNITDHHATASNITEVPTIMWIEGDTLD